MIVGICSFRPSNWISCRTIVQNLRDVYQQIYNDSIKFIDLSHEATEVELLETAKGILGLAPKTIIFLDHYPHPYQLIKYLHSRLSKNVKILFHLYGSFPNIDSEKWCHLESLIKDRPIKFLAASTRHLNYSKNFIPDDKNLSWCPFPISEDRFFPDSQNRIANQKLLNIPNDSHIWLYAGRLSYQKNIHSIIEAFTHHKKNFTSDHLVLAGHVDNIGSDIQGIKFYDNEYFHIINEVMNRLDPIVKESIHFIGNYREAQLNDVYNLADSFISLSTYHNDDFGISIAEALKAGLPCLLTDWGGYYDFGRLLDEDVHLSKVHFSDNKLTLNMNEIISLMRLIRENTHNKNLTAKRFEANFGKATIKSLIQNIMNSDFQSFSHFSSDLKLFSEYWANGQSPFAANKLLTLEYKRVYGPYFE